MYTVHVKHTIIHDPSAMRHSSNRPADLSQGVSVNVRACHVFQLGQGHRAERSKEEREIRKESKEKADRQEERYEERKLE